MFRREKRHVRGRVQLRAGPDGLARGLDVAHPELGVPADVDGVDLGRARFTGIHGLDAGLRERVTDAARAQHERPPDAATRHVLRRHARRRDHLRIVRRQARFPELRGLVRRRVSAAVRQQHERERTLLERGQRLDGAGQELIRAERTVTEQQRAVDIEHQSANLRCPIGAACSAA